MDFTWELMGERLVVVLSRYRFNSLSRVGGEINGHDMPWIFLPEEEESLPISYRRIMFLMSS